MTPIEKPDQSISLVHQELDALRKRLDQAPEWFRGAESAIRAAALAKEVERLCREASQCKDPREAESLLAASRLHLDQLQTLLGSH